MPYSGVQVTSLSPLGVGWSRIPALTLALGAYNTTTTTTTTTTSTTSTSTTSTSTSTTSSTTSTTSSPPVFDTTTDDSSTTRTLTTPVNTPPPVYYAGWPGGGADTSTSPYCVNATSRFYLKFFPQWNDNRGSHGDDQLNDGEVSVVEQTRSGQMSDGVIALDLVGGVRTTIEQQISDSAGATSDDSTPSMLEPHYTPMNIIGNAIESYGGYKTVQVYKGNYLLYSERRIELLKYIEWPWACMQTTEEITFRLRTEIGSSYFKDYKSYVRVVWHEAPCP